MEDCTPFPTLPSLGPFFFSPPTFSSLGPSKPSPQPSNRQPPRESMSPCAPSQSVVTLQSQSVHHHIHHCKTLGWGNPLSCHPRDVTLVWLFPHSHQKRTEKKFHAQYHPPQEVVAPPKRCQQRNPPLFPSHLSMGRTHTHKPTSPSSRLHNLRRWAPFDSRNHGYNCTRVWTVTLLAEKRAPNERRTPQHGTHTHTHTHATRT